MQFFVTACGLSYILKSKEMSQSRSRRDGEQIKTTQTSHMKQQTHKQRSTAKKNRLGIVSRKTTGGFIPAKSHLSLRCSSKLRYNLNGSNMDGSFTVDDSNSFFSPYKIFPIAEENKYLVIFFLFYHGIVCCMYSLESPHRGDSNEYIHHTIVV